MEKDYSRALRRHHIARLKKTRSKYVVYNWWPLDEHIQARRLGQLTQYPTACSCHMCGNPRKWFKHRTIHELQDFDRLQDGLKDIDDEK